MAMFASLLLTVVVALLHIYFLVLEMFLWTEPAGRRVFRTTPEFAEASRVLAANQGLYNGFLAAGLLWGVSIGPSGSAIRLFFLGCVVIAGRQPWAGRSSSCRRCRRRLPSCSRSWRAASFRVVEPLRPGKCRCANGALRQSCFAPSRPTTFARRHSPGDLECSTACLVHFVFPPSVSAAWG